jgi:DNA polymerase-3 subunit beta
MKATVLQENLLPKVTTVARVASARSALPVLENILLSCEKGRLSLAATDLETGIQTSVGAKVQESGSLTVPARLLAGLVGNLPSGKVTLETNKEVLKVVAEGISSKINGLSAEEFPSFSVEGKPLLSIDGGKLKKAIDQVSFAAAQDESRPILTGVLFHLGKKELTLTGVDGFRLAEKRLKVSSTEVSSEEEFSLVIPARGLGEASRLIGGGEVKILTSEETQLLFVAEEFAVFSQSLEGDFPDYEQIIPTNSTTTLEFEKEELAKAVQLTSVFSDKGMNVIKLAFDLGKKAMKVSSQEAESGEVSVTVGIKGEGKKDTIAFNSRYLADALSAFDSDKISLSLSSGLDPALFKAGNDPSYLHVIMPVRVQD